jgi:hypothetical protein
VRAIGFDDASISVSLAHDRKVRALSRQVGDPAQTAATMFLYVCVVLASWETGDRETFDAALPWWWTEAPDLTDARLASLTAVGLLGEDGRLPERSWTNHSASAIARKTRLIEQAGTGGRTTQRRRRAEREVERTLERTLKSDGLTDGPSRARANGGVRGVVDAEDIVSAPPLCGECGKIIESLAEGTFRSGRIVHRTHAEEVPT